MTEESVAPMFFSSFLTGEITTNLLGAVMSSPSARAFVEAGGKRPGQVPAVELTVSFQIRSRRQLHDIPEAKFDEIVLDAPAVQERLARSHEDDPGPAPYFRLRLKASAVAIKVFTGKITSPPIPIPQHSIAK
jgi:hypothetical protein